LYEPTLPVVRGQGPSLALRYDRGSSPWIGDVQLRTLLDARAGRLTQSDSAPLTFGRLYAGVELDLPLASQHLVLRSTGGAAWSDGPLPVQQLLFAGGPVTAPGYAFHQFAGARLLTLDAEWHIPIPLVPIPLGPFGRIPGRGSIVPLGNAALLGNAPSRPMKAGWYPSLGVAILSIYDLLRMEVARGLRGGRWTFSVDISRDFWRIL
jgi:hypothetical protein